MVTKYANEPTATTTYKRRMKKVNNKESGFSNFPFATSYKLRGTSYDCTSQAEHIYRFHSKLIICRAIFFSRFHFVFSCNIQSRFLLTRGGDGRRVRISISTLNETPLLMQTGIVFCLCPNVSSTVYTHTVLVERFRSHESEGGQKAHGNNVI